MDSQKVQPMNISIVGSHSLNGFYSILLSFILYSWPVLYQTRTFAQKLISDYSTTMITQERLLGFVLGSAFTGFGVLEQRRSIYRSISNYQLHYPNHSNISLHQDVTTFDETKSSSMPKTERVKRTALSTGHDRYSVAEKQIFGLVRPASEYHVHDAVATLKAGNVIAVPTDTIYGFACDACASEAIQHIYEIKGRVHTKPLSICVGDVSDIKRFVVVDYLPHGLLDSLFPGPVTVVLKRGGASDSEKFLNPGADSLGVRIPDSSFIRAISRSLGTAIALTSANLSGKPSSISIKEFEDLWFQCRTVYDGGVLSSGRAGSTVIDLTMPGTYKILRAGSWYCKSVTFLSEAPEKKQKGYCKVICYRKLMGGDAETSLVQ